MKRVPWATFLLVAGCAVVQGAGLAPEFEYRRGTAAAWRLLGGQLAHWNGAMAVADLSVVLVAGWFLETRSRRTALSAVVLGALATATVLGYQATDVLVYRGSSGIASALAVTAAIMIASARGKPALRWTAVGGVLLFLGKMLWEASGHPAPGSSLPAGISAMPSVHLAGALAGGLVALSVRRERPPQEEKSLQGIRNVSIRGVGP